MHNEHLTCIDCGAAFLFSADYRARFASDDLALPKRCGRCRQARHDRVETASARYVDAFSDVDARRALFRERQKKVKKGQP